MSKQQKKKEMVNPSDLKLGLFRNLNPVYVIVVSFLNFQSPIHESYDCYDCKVDYACHNHDEYDVDYTSQY